MAFGYCNPEHKTSIHLILIALQPCLGQKDLCFCNLPICSHPNAGTRKQTGKPERYITVQSPGDQQEPLRPHRANGSWCWWLFLGSQYVPVRPLSCWTWNVLVKPIYGIKQCLSSSMLCVFVTVSKAPSAAAGLLPQLWALMLWQHLLVNFLLKAGIVLPVKSLAGVILTIMCWKSWMSAGISATFCWGWQNSSPFPCKLS